MAIDKSKENTRIQNLLDMGLDAVKIKTMIGIDNPNILKQFITEEEMNWDYAVAAGLLEESDAQRLKNTLIQMKREKTILNK